MWKAKARKLLVQCTKNKIDESRLTACVLEGNSLPFSSRLKDILKGMLDNKKSSDNTVSSASNVKDVTSSSSGGEVLSSTRKAGKPSTTFGSFTGGRIGSVPQDIPDSSDDEATFVKSHTTSGTGINSNNAAAAGFRQGCRFDPTTIADESPIKWPVTLSTVQKALNVDMVTQVMKSHSNNSNSSNSTTSAGGSSGNNNNTEENEEAEEEKETTDA